METYNERRLLRPSQLAERRAVDVRRDVQAFDPDIATPIEDNSMVQVEALLREYNGTLPRWFEYADYAAFLGHFDVMFRIIPQDRMTTQLWDRIVHTIQMSRPTRYVDGLQRILRRPEYEFSAEQLVLEALVHGRREVVNDFLEQTQVDMTQVRRMALVFGDKRALSQLFELGHDRREFDALMDIINDEAFERRNQMYLFVLMRGDLRGLTNASQRTELYRHLRFTMCTWERDHGRLHTVPRLRRPMKEDLDFVNTLKRIYLVHGANDVEALLTLIEYAQDKRSKGIDCRKALRRRRS